MAKRRGNPNWGKRQFVGSVGATVTEFEKVARSLKLEPGEYVRSNRLRDWAQRNKNTKFVPESLLKAWGFVAECDSTEAA